MKSLNDILDHLSNMLLGGHLVMVLFIPMFLIDGLPELKDVFGDFFGLIVTLAFIGFVLAGLWWICRLIQATRAATEIGDRRQLLWLSRASIAATWLGFTGLVASTTLMVVELFFVTVSLNAEIAHLVK